jgi:hypothetical protein
MMGSLYLHIPSIGCMMIQVMNKWQMTSLLVIPPLVQASFILTFWLTLPHEENSKLGMPSLFPFAFLCDYADQYEEHMTFIAKKLEIIKGEIASFHEKIQQGPDHSKGEKLSGLASCSFTLEKSRTWARGELTSMNDEAIKILILNIVTIAITNLYTIHNRTFLQSHLL